MPKNEPEILVVGGAGYIGSHMCKALSRNGYRPVVLDNLVYGHKHAVKWGDFHCGAMADASLLRTIFKRHDIAAVMHFAAFCYVGESVDRPDKYYRNNVADTIGLVDAMIEHGVSKFIFSSSCATYGEPKQIPIPESHPQQPINPYGRTKLMVEQILEDYHRAFGLQYVALRYFNAAGADPEGELGEDHYPETHLIPLVLQVALKQRASIQVFGEDYATKDRTCIRDYIHVHDLAAAHLLALEDLLSNGPVGCYNLGNGGGYSVREVIDTARRVTGADIPAVVSARRPGDPAVLVGSGKKAAAQWGWRPVFADIDSIIETAWQWHRAHPEGYPE